MVKPTMVSRTSKNFCKKLTTSTSAQRSTEGSCRNVESTRNAEFTATIGLDSLKSQLGRTDVAGVLNRRHLH